jgi:hypothetical protein
MCVHSMGLGGGGVMRCYKGFKVFILVRCRYKIVIRTDEDSEGPCDALLCVQVTCEV